MMETIEDIVRNMRDFENLAEDGYDQYEAYRMLCWFADRIEKAARHEMSDEFSAEIQKLTDELYEVKKANIRLKAALKPVLDCDVSTESFLSCAVRSCVDLAEYLEGINEMKEQTIAGDIRRLRDRMTIHNGSVMVNMDYFELLKLFDSIETKAKRMKDSLQPVLAVSPSSFDPNYFKGGSWVTPVYDGKLCEAAVLEAQKIWKEGEKERR